jgi:predicted Zn-dependent peptidase
VQIVSTKEHAWAYMEQCVEQLFEYGAIRSVEYMLQKVESITPEEVRAAFEAMLEHKPAIALVGAVSAKSKAKALSYAS